MHSTQNELFASKTNSTVVNRCGSNSVLQHSAERPLAQRSERFHTTCMYSRIRSSTELASILQARILKT
jgi:hypothetical protein